MRFAALPRRNISHSFRIVASALVVCALAVCTHARAQWTEAVQVRHAAYAVAGAPSALVHAGPNFDPSQPLHLVVYLHGFMGCTEVLMRSGPVACKPGMSEESGWGLADAHDSAGTNTLFVIAQLAFMKRSGEPGCFAREGCFRAFVTELLAALPNERLGAKKRLRDVAAITLVAHSAGYRSALAVLEQGGATALVRELVLLDALYGEEDRFFAWAREHKGALLLSLHIGSGKPAENSAKLLRMAARTLPKNSSAKLDAEVAADDFASALRGKRVAIAHVKSGHRELPRAYLGRVLRALSER